MLTMTILATLALGNEITLSGELRHEARLEGGTWILRSEGTDWCLHGVPEGFRSGDRVTATGRARPDRVCIHMAGPIFQLSALKREPGFAGLRGPRGCETCGSCVCRCRKWNR
jgi:hypothetical protein